MLGEGFPGPLMHLLRFSCAADKLNASLYLEVCYGENMEVFVMQIMHGMQGALRAI